MLDATQAEEKGPTPAQLAQRDRFERLYSDWHRARADVCHPDLPEDDTAASARARILEETERRLLTTPSPLPFGVWYKWEVLDFLVTNEAESGEYSDNRVIVAVAAIKADVLRFGLGDSGHYPNA